MRLFLILIFILIVQKFPFASAESAPIFSELTQHCVANLDEVTIAKALQFFSHTDLLPLASGPGWFLSPWQDSSHRRQIRVLPELQRPPSTWLHEVWTSGKSTYSFLNVGYRQFEADANFMNAIVLDHLKYTPRAELELRVSLLRAAQETILRGMRWAVHHEVRSVYAARKKYLTSQDFATLDLVNQYTSNYDVLVVIEDGGEFAWDKMTPESRLDRLTDTIQITYLGYRHYFKPSLRGILISAGVHFDESADKFPFAGRLTGEAGHDFYERFNLDFDPATTAEFTRMVNFRRRSTAVRKRFILEVLRLAKARGMKTIIAATDARTSAYFEREYGFSVYRRLPTTSDTPEYLMQFSLDQNQPGPQKEFARLERAAALVSVEDRTDEP